MTGCQNQNPTYLEARANQAEKTKSEQMFDYLDYITGAAATTKEDDDRRINMPSPVMMDATDGAPQSMLQGKLSFACSPYVFVATHRRYFEAAKEERLRLIADFGKQAKPSLSEADFNWKLNQAAGVIMTEREGKR